MQTYAALVVAVAVLFGAVAASTSAVFRHNAIINGAQGPTDTPFRRTCVRSTVVHLFCESCLDDPAPRPVPAADTASVPVQMTNSQTTGDTKQASRKQGEFLPLKLKYGSFLNVFQAALGNITPATS